MYLDSGIIVKLLVREPDSEYFNTALSGHALESSELCLTEVSSALFSKERAGAITARERKKAAEQFAQLISDELLSLVPLDVRTLNRASAILEACHPRVALRTLDALHVAACDMHESDSLCTTDTRMRQAAAQIGIRLFPENP